MIIRFPAVLGTTHIKQYAQKKREERFQSAFLQYSGQHLAILALLFIAYFVKFQSAFLRYSEQHEAERSSRKKWRRVSIRFPAVLGITPQVELGDRIHGPVWVSIRFPAVLETTPPI